LSTKRQSGVRESSSRERGENYFSQFPLGKGNPLKGELPATKENERAKTHWREINIRREGVAIFNYPKEKFRPDKEEASMTISKKEDPGSQRRG